VGTRNDDISLILAKAKKQGFLPDVSDSEVDMLEIEARKMFGSDSAQFKPTELRKLQNLNSTVSAMAVPPTLTTGAVNAASTITNAVNFPYNTNKVNIYGGIPRLRNTNGINSYQNGTVADTAANENPPLFVEWITDAPVLEWGAFGGATGSSVCYRLKIDGQYVNVTPQAGPGSTGGKHRYKVDNGSRAIRRYVLELSNIEFCGIDIGPTDSIWAPVKDKALRALFVTDSYGEGTGGNPLTSWQYTTSRLLGWTDVWSAPEGGTGYLNAGPAGRKTFFDRLATDVYPYAPEVLVIAGGINDTVSNNAGWTLASGLLEKAARTLYSEIAKNLPNTRLYVVNTWYPLAPVYAPIEDAHLAIVSAATNNSNVTALINPRGWITGTGKVGSTTGSGNADLFTTSDSIHPTQAGHDFLGYNVASAISATY
jgi:lysophospholipase L1-like esterase